MKHSKKRGAKKKKKKKDQTLPTFLLYLSVFAVVFGALLFFISRSQSPQTVYISPYAESSKVDGFVLPKGTEKYLESFLSKSSKDEEGIPEKKEEPKLDKARYDELLKELANCPEIKAEIPYTQEATKEMTDYECLWPAKGNPYPTSGALLPFNRIVAYYGNFYSTQMGILGEYKSEEVLEKLMAQIAKWEKADPDTPVIPAIDYIAVTAQASAGPDGNYNLRMPDDQIKHALDMARKVEGIVILEVQAGLADLLGEIKLLEDFLKKPTVHLAIDPEFAMRRGHKPGEWIGTVTAWDVNQAIKYLSSLVKKYDLPPKILLVHRFTYDMVQSSEAIAPTPQVQVVMVMDGWGPKPLKRATWYRVINPEPVQFTGFKVFYENDRWEPSTGIMTPKEILKLRPKPIYIQYQ